MVTGIKDKQQVWESGESAANLSRVLTETCARSVLLVCGDSFRRQAMYEKIVGCVAKCGAQLTEFSQFHPNPEYESVELGAAVCREQNIDFIIAAGGGSPMDVAKCIRLKMAEETGGSQAAPVPFLAIPTTAGTGSEATRFAVVYRDGEKVSVEDERCLPDFCILDEELLASLPEYQRKATMMDALCHAIESFWAVGSTEESRRYSAEAIRLILSCADGYLRGEPKESRQMLLAANIAGKAINIAKTTAGHAMCYKLTTVYGISHGHAAALCVAKLWRYMNSHTDRCVDVRGEAYVKKILSQIAECMGCETSEAAAGKFGEIVEKLGLKAIAKQDGLGISKDAAERLADSVNQERLKNNPIALDKAALTEMYEEIGVL